MKISPRQLLLVLFMTTITLVHAATRSDTPVITTDFCQTTAITKIEGTSTESAGSLIEVFIRVSELDVKVSLGTTTVNPDGSWALEGISVSAGLLSATVTASGEVVSLPTAEVAITVPPVISQGVLSNPTVCGVLDGTVQLLGFLPFTEYDLYYTDESGFQSLTVTADALGQVTLSGLGAGEIQEIYAGLNGCVSNTICSIKLIDPILPSLTLGVPVQPLICGGTGEIVIVGAPLQALDYQVAYFDGTSTVGPTTITSSVLGTITITGLAPGVYSNFEITRNGCSSGLLLDRITIFDPIVPTIASGLITPPSTCTALDGSIELTGLSLNTTYDVLYEDLNGTTVSTTLSTPLAGTTLTLPNLGEGVFKNLRVVNGGCQSRTLGDISLSATTPNISLLSADGPLNCLSADGAITIDNLVPFDTYDVHFSVDGVLQPTVSATADASGILEITGLGAGAYTDLYVSQGNCESNVLTDIIGLDEIDLPEISLGVPSLPSTCAATDGSITLLGLPVTDYLYDITYINSLGVQTESIMSVSGAITITNLLGDNYSDIQVSLNGCESNTIVCPIDLTKAPALTLGVVTPETACGAGDGSISLIGLQANENYDITYRDSNGVQSLLAVNSGALGTITLTGLSADTYSDLTVTVGGCTSEPLADISLGSLLNITLGTTVNPTSCGASDGSIALAGLLGSTTYDVTYVSDAGSTTVSLASDGLGNLTIPSLSAGNYSDISVDNGSCSSNTLLDVVSLTEVGVPNITLGASVNPSACGTSDGSITLGGLLATTTYTVNYITSAGPQSGSFLTDALGVLTITGLGADSYQDITVATGGCTSDPLPSIVSLVDVGTPVLNLGTTINPTTCGASDGIIELTGLLASTAYDVIYTNSGGVQAPVSITSDGTGKLTIAGLSVDVYEDIKVSIGGCISASVGPIELKCFADAVYTVYNQTIDQLTDTDTLAIPSDTDGPVVCASVQSGSLPAGTAIDAVDGVITVTAQGDLTTGTTTATIRIIDQKGDSTFLDVSITILNDKPQANPDTYTVNEGDTLNVTDADGSGGNPTYYGVLVNDADIANSGLTATKINDPAYHTGTFTLNPNGTFEYIHDGSETSSDSFSYRVADGLGEADTTTVSITILPVNDAPVAVDDAYTFDEGSTNNVNATLGILANDSDPEDSTLTIVLIQSPAEGALTLNADGSFTYTHNGSETIADSFTYKVNDGALDSDTATVSITITPQNDAPVAVADGYTFDEGATNNVAAGTGVLANDSDADGDAITAILVSDVAYGTLTLNADGSFTYTHDGSETTSDSFSYKVNDGTVDGDTAIVSITITPQNDAPVAVADSYTFDEGSTNNVAAGTGVLNNDSDADGDAITAILVSDVANGTLTLNTDGSFTYTHDGSETTGDSFTYTVNDGTVNGDTVTVSFTITPQNDAPVALADSYTFDEGATNNIAAGTGVLVNDSDADGDAITAILVSDVANGTLTLNADGSFTYTHDGSETTGDSFNYTVNDGTVNGDTVTVSFTITPQNDAPVAVADSYTFDEGATNNVAAGTGVLANDSDADGDAITAILVSDVSNGTLTLNADGSFTYTHDGSETTSDSFSYKVNDGTVDGDTAIVSITITPQNDAPVAVADSYTFDEGTSNNVAAGTGVLANDSDADGDAITAILVSDISNGTLTLNADGSFTYTHDGSETTGDSFTYTVNDGTVNGDTVTVSFTITPQNDAPVAVADGYTFDEGSTNNVAAGTGVLANDSDADGDAITAILVSDVSNGTLTLNADGSFTYTHDGSETTSDSFSYKVNDGTVDGDTAIVSITITPQNDAPVAVADSYTFDEGSTNNVAAGTGVLANDSDADEDAITAILVSDVSNGTLTLNADGSFTYTHDGSETTGDSFTYTVNDGTVNGDTVTVSFTITPQNDAPVAVADSYTFDEGSTNNVAAGTGVLTNDSDADGDAITAILVSDVSNGTLTLNADGSFTYTHDGSTTTSDSFSYKVNDGTVDGNTVTVMLTITPSGGGNSAPVAVADAMSLNRGATQTTVNSGASSVLDNDSDADGDAITAILVTNVSSGSLTFNADGTFAYTHDSSAALSDSFTYKVNDGTIDGNTVTVSITINRANASPIPNDDNYSLLAGASMPVAPEKGVLVNDSDPEGDAISAILVTNVTHGTLSFSSDGSFTYTHDNSATAADQFTYKLTDGISESGTATVYLSISDSNTPPVAVADTYTFEQGSSNTVAATSGVLANDSDADGDAINAILVSDATNGTLVLNTDGSFEYTHDGSAATSDSFTYKVNDGTEDGNTVTVTFNIIPTGTGTNQPPVADNDAATVNKGETAIINIAEGDVDPDGTIDVTSIVIVKDPTNGDLAINGDGTVTFTHDNSENTGDSFEYTIQDNEGALSNIASVAVEIIHPNTPPEAVADTYTFNNGSANSILAEVGVLANDSDPDGDAITAILVTTVANGTLSFNADGSFNYTHDGSATTSDSFTYKVNDGTEDGNTVTVTLTINAATGGGNVPPVADNDAATLNEGESAWIDVADGDTDADGTIDVTSIVIVSQPTNGTLTINGDGTVTYEHDGSETTSDSFSYTINDNEGATSNEATVYLTVNSVNDAPVAVADQTSVTMGGTVSKLSTSEPSVLANDSDPDGDALTAILVSDVSQGTLTLQADGTFEYTHNGDRASQDSFEYKVNDGTIDGNTVTVTILINRGANRLPTANDDAATTTEGNAVAIDVIANDEDPDGFIDAATVNIESMPANGVVTINSDGTVTYMHDGSEVWSDSFTYTVLDNEGATTNVATVTITIIPTNEPPVAVADAMAVARGRTQTVLDGGNTSVLDNDSDPENNALTAILVTDVAHGTLSLNANGTFSYTHDNSATSSDSFDYKVNDGELDGNTVTVTITINETANAAPIADDDFEEVLRGGTVVINVADGDWDPDGDLDINTITLMSEPQYGTWAMAGGMVEYTHDGSSTTQDQFTYQVYDQTGLVSNLATVTIQVLAGNQPPIANDDAATVSFREVVLINVSENDQDPDGELDLAAIQVVDQPQHGELSVNNDGTVTYLHEGNDVNEDVFTYMIADTEGNNSNVATVTLTILPAAAEAVEVPNAFTPDGDGVNDTWEIPDIVKYPNNMVKVFNRWGNKIAEIKGYNNTTRVWDATAEVQFQLGNEKVPAGTYFYTIDLGDGEKPLSGFVVVSR